MGATIGLLEVNRQLLFDGAVNGLVYGMLAMGVVLVYRSTRVINFAVGNMGLPGAGLLALLTLRWDVPFWVSLGLALAVGVIFAAVIELAVIRRLFTAPRVILLVATIGVAQLAQGILLAYPEVGGGIGERYPVAITNTVTDLVGIDASAAQLVILIVAPLVALGLVLGMDHTSFGRTVQATAANPDLSRISGISPKRVSTIVWLIAGLVSTLAAILLSGGTSVSGLENIGPNTMASALAAAVIGGMRSFRGALAGGLVVGLGFAIAKFNYPVEAGLFEFLLFIVVLGAVAWQSRSAGAGEGGRYSFAPKVRPIPARVLEIWWVRHLTTIGVSVAGLLAIALPLLVTTASRQITYTTILAFAICAVSVTVITGWSGQLSLGQMAFAGIGALSAAAFSRGVELDIGWGETRLIDVESAGLPFLVSIVLASFLSAAVAGLVGIGALRVKGLLSPPPPPPPPLATQTYLFRRPFFSDGGSSSVPFGRGSLFGLDLDDQRSYYWFVLAVLVVLLFVISRLRASAVGRGILALRDNADGAAAYAVRPVRTKLRAFALAGGIAGLGGALLAGVIEDVPLTGRFFDTTESLRLISMVIIGGLGSVIGPVLGALWVVGLPAFAPTNRLVPLFTSSVGLLVLLLYFPGGLVQVGYSARDRLVVWLEGRLGPAPAKSSSGVTPRLGARPRRSHVEDSVDDGSHPPDLAVAGLTVRFGGKVAVDGVSMHVQAGEVVGLIGTNGAGKSTLMNAVGGFVPSTGSVELFGTDISSTNAPARAGLGLGRTFQAATLFPELTVRETVLVALESRNAPGLLAVATGFPPASAAARAHRSAAGDLIDFLGLGRYADIHTADLSTGTRRIVELAGLLAMEARVLCLDEPTAGVAQREAEAFGPLMLRIREQLEASMVVIEHDMPLIMSMSDRVYCLEAGAVIAEGAPDEVRNNPLVVASYLGTNEKAIARSDS